MEGAQKDEWVMNLLKLDVNATSWVIHNCAKLPWWFTLHDGILFFVWSGLFLCPCEQEAELGALGWQWFRWLLWFQPPVWRSESMKETWNLRGQNDGVDVFHSIIVSLAFLLLLCKYIFDKTEQVHKATRCYKMRCMLIGWEGILSSPETSLERYSCCISAVVLVIYCFSSEYFLMFFDWSDVSYAANTS